MTERYWIAVQYDDTVDVLDAFGSFDTPEKAQVALARVAEVARDWDGAVSVFIMLDGRVWL